MKIYLITDTHFSHKAMIPLCGRPEGFEEKIFRNLTRVIMPGDILVHLGDICMGNDEMWNERFNMKVNGKHWLVKGNHDNKSNNWYMNHNWDFVGNTITDTYFGKKIVFSHVPIPDDGTFDLNIHGHFHNSLHRLKDVQWALKDRVYQNSNEVKHLTPKHKLLAIEYTNYKPVLLEEFIKEA